MNPTYNGWRNYATWRVMLEMGFGDRDDWPDVFGEKPDVYALADVLRDETDNYIEESVPDSELVRGWAQAFVEDADYQEMAENILSDWPDDEGEEQDR